MTSLDVARQLPAIDVVRSRCRSLAMLDAILSPEWEYRYYSFDARWGPGQEMASMRNGSGDAWSIVFEAAGAFMRGFDHESVMSPMRVEPPRLWPGLVEAVPPVFAAQVAEPAFTIPGVNLIEATFCLWRRREDSAWQVGDITFAPGEDPDGSAWMCELLTNGAPAAYQRFAEDYYEVGIDLAAVEHLYELRPLTDDVVQALNPAVSIGDLADDVAEVGYPE